MGCDWWEIIISLDNGLATNRQQAIETYDDPVQLCIYAAHGGDELTTINETKFQKDCKLLNLVFL